MDTDDLLDETYNAIMVEAEKFNHTLTLRFGSLSSRCKNEYEFIDESIELINYLRKGNLDCLSSMFLEKFQT